MNEITMKFEITFTNDLSFFVEFENHDQLENWLAYNRASIRKMISLAVN